MASPHLSYLGVLARARAGWRRACAVDGRTGRAVVVTHRASEPGWAEVWGAHATLTWERLTRVHTSRGAEVFRGDPRGDGAVCFVKVFIPRGPMDRLYALLRFGRAPRAWLRALHAAGLGFRVIRPVCLVTARAWFRPGREMLVTSEESGARPLHEWLQSTRRARLVSLAERRRVLAALGREVARWHAAGLVHGDLHLGNLLIRYQGEEPEFTWLDIENNRYWPLGVPLARRVKNLADMNYTPNGLSRTDRLRIWNAYREASGLAPARAKRLRNLVLERTRRRWRKRGWIS